MKFFDFSVCDNLRLVSCCFGLLIDAIEILAQTLNQVLLALQIQIVWIAPNACGGALVAAPNCVVVTARPAALNVLVEPAAPAWSVGAFAV